MQRIALVCFELLEIRMDGMDSSLYAYVSNEEDAIKWKGQNAFRDYRFVNKTYLVFDTLDEMKEEKQIELRRQALAKLSLEERVALGL